MAGGVRCATHSALRHGQVMEGVSRMTNDDRLFGYRLQLLSLAAEIGVRPACRAMGVHHSTYYRWRRQVERNGLEVLRPRERRRPKMPNQIPAMVEERIVAFSLGHPGLGPKRIAAQRRSPPGARPRRSPAGWRATCRRLGGASSAC